MWNVGNARIGLAIPLLAAIVYLLPLPEAAADSRLERLDVLVVKIDFEDQPGRVDPTEFEEEWVQPMVDFFDHVSNGRFDLRTTVLDEIVTLGPRRLYHACRGEDLEEGESCQNLWIDDTAAIDAAVDAGIADWTEDGLTPAGGDEEDVFEGVLFVTVLPDNEGCTGDPFVGWTINGQRIAGDDSEKSYTMMHSAVARTSECEMKDKPWGGAAHEVGHAVSNLFGHPANYVNGWELMDSCYPCSPGIFTRIARTALDGSFRSWFDGWVEESKLHRVSAPEGETTVLAPVELQESETSAPQGLQVETATAQSYILECRRFIYPDEFLEDLSSDEREEGVLILKATPGGDWETRVMPAPDVGDDESPWLSTYTPGEVFTDSDNDITFRIGPFVELGCTVTVDFGPDSEVPVPDVAMIPWQTPPMNTWETIDIWVDSSCNGYRAEDPSDPSRLRYGVRDDAEQTVVGNGDDPCLGHENRVYARVRNLGGAEAIDVRVRFEVTRPLGTGIRGASGWRHIGTATPEDFESLSSISPGEHADVYVPWVPTDPAVTTPGRFRTHSCLRVIIEEVDGERVTTNQDGDGEQENIAWFEARVEERSGEIEPMERELFLANDHNETREFYLSIESELPDGWSLDVADGQVRHVLEGGEVKILPVRIVPALHSEPGQSYFARVQAFRKVALTSSDGASAGFESRRVAGVTLATQIVREQRLEISGTVERRPDAVRVEPSVLKVEGRLQPEHDDARVMIDYTSPSGRTTSRWAQTDSDGRFASQLEESETGEWKAVAFWSGTREHGSAESREIVLTVSEDDDSQWSWPVILGIAVVLIVALIGLVRIGR